MTFIAVLTALIILIIYVTVDLLIKGANAFMDRWVRRTVWLWLPFYALYALTKNFLAKMEGKK